MNKPLESTYLENENFRNYFFTSLENYQLSEKDLDSFESLRNKNMDFNISQFLNSLKKKSYLYIFGYENGEPKIFIDPKNHNENIVLGIISKDLGIKIGFADLNILGAKNKIELWIRIIQNFYNGFEAQIKDDEKNLILSFLNFCGENIGDYEKLKTYKMSKKVKEKFFDISNFIIFYDKNSHRKTSYN